jgi:hypothetical protein
MLHSYQDLDIYKPRFLRGDHPGDVAYEIHSLTRYCAEEDDC